MVASQVQLPLVALERGALIDLEKTLKNPKCFVIFISPFQDDFVETPCWSPGGAVLFHGAALSIPDPPSFFHGLRSVRLQDGLHEPGEPMISLLLEVIL